MPTAASKATLWAKLREPFPPATIGKLPRVTCYQCRESQSKTCGSHQKRECQVCHNWITTAHIHLDYVGHAAVTNRLLSVDPEWTWSAMQIGEDGLPAFDRNGGLWITLTILGVSRPGYGDAEGKRGGDAVKVAIGDAIRNAAMRFGVGLDLWSKEDLQSSEQAEQPTALRAVPPPADNSDSGLDDHTGIIWIAVPAGCSTIGELTEKAKLCSDAGKYVGEVKAAFFTRREELLATTNEKALTADEKALKLVKDKLGATAVG